MVSGPQAQIPSWFGNYRLTARVATGGMAEVYVGRKQLRDGTMGPMVAVKRLFPHLVSNTSIVQMFLNEARITAQIHHPNVVEVLDLGHENGEPFIAMELLEGRTFAEIRTQSAQIARHVPLGIILRILCEACRGLDAAHRAVDDQGRLLCIVHRDFTPDNIHVSVDGAIKVIDFGIAQASTIDSNTEPGTLKGKFFYMSPEMIAARPLDHRADIFAAGVMLYEQLCGRRPFTGSGTEEVMRRISEGRPRRPSEFDPSVPLSLENVCLIALSPDPAKRFSSMEEFIGAIESLGSDTEIASPKQVGAYVNELFPAEVDPQRQLLRRIRLADPSQPGIPAAKVNDSAAAPSAGDSADQSETKLMDLSQVFPEDNPDEKGTRVRDVDQARPGPLSVPKPRNALRRSRLLKATLALLLVTFIVVFYFNVWPGQKTLSERLDEASALSDPAALAQALRALPEDPQLSEQHFRRASELLLEAGAFDAALQFSEHFALHHPDSPTAAIYQARALIGLQKEKQAETVLHKAMELGPSDHRPELLLAEIKEGQGDLQGALDAINHSAKKKPLRSTFVRRASLLAQLGELNEAEETLTSLIQKKFDSDTAVELAYVKIQKDQAGEALGLLRRAIKERPRHAKAHYYFGTILSRQGDGRGAERAFRESDRLAPKSPRALLALCKMQSTLGEREAVEETVRLLNARFPEQATAMRAQCAP
jgi:Flp pilus assembly protein TadD